jgi:hypothetical protein
MADDGDRGVVVADAGCPSRLIVSMTFITLLRVRSGSKRTTLPTAFEDLGTKQHAANGQKDRDATADQASRYGLDRERDVSARNLVNRPSIRPLPRSTLVPSPPRSVAKVPVSSPG